MTARGSYAILAIVLIVALIGGTALFNMGFNAWRNFNGSDGTDDGSNGFNGDGGNQTSGAESQKSVFGIGVSILFTDGSSEKASPKDAPFQILPLTIMYNGKAVSSITWSFEFVVEWEGEMTDFTLTGYVSGVAWREGSVHDLWWTTEGKVATYILPENGVWRSLWSRTLSASEIEQKAQTNGEFHLITDGSAQVTATFSSGFTDSKEATAHSDITVNNVEGLTVLAVQVTPKMAS